MPGVRLELTAPGLKDHCSTIELTEHMVGSGVEPEIMGYEPTKQPC